MSTRFEEACSARAQRTTVVKKSALAVAESNWRASIRSADARNADDGHIAYNGPNTPLECERHEGAHYHPNHDRGDQLHDFALNLSQALDTN